MESIQNLFEILDEIRKSKNVSVSDLCQNIISERTYYRYLKGNSTIKFEIYNQLMKRLNASINDVIYYSFFVRKGDPGLTRFTYRQHLRYHKDINDVYVSVKDYQPENKVLQIVFNVSLRRYEYSIGKLTKKEFRSFYESILTEIKEVDMPNIFATYVYSMFFIDFPNDIHSSDQTLDEIIGYILAFNRGESIIFAMNTMDNILKLVTEKVMVNKLIYKNLVNKFQETVDIFTVKYYLMRFQLYKAYLFKIEDKKNQMKEYLLRYIANVMSLLHGEYYDEAISFIEKTFEINAMDYFYHHFEELLK